MKRLIGLMIALISNNLCAEFSLGPEGLNSQIEHSAAGSISINLAEDLGFAETGASKVNIDLPLGHLGITSGATLKISDRKIFDLVITLEGFNDLYSNQNNQYPLRAVDLVIFPNGESITREEIENELFLLRPDSEKFDALESMMLEGGTSSGGG